MTTTLLLACIALGGGDYVCPAARDAVLEAQPDEPIIIHIFDPEATSGDGWECAEGWCSFDYGLVDGEDALESHGGGMVRLKPKMRPS